jgi:hypothetical protein
LFFIQISIIFVHEPSFFLSSRKNQYLLLKMQNAARPLGLKVTGCTYRIVKLHCRDLLFLT